MSRSITAVIVAYSDPARTSQAVRALQTQTRPLARVIVVDNHPDGRTATLLTTAPGVTVIHSARNSGYAGGNALGAAQASSDYLLFINPDAVADPACAERLARVLDEHPQAAVAGAQILLPDGQVNAGENPLHLTGLSWSGRLEQDPEYGEPRPALAVSGACLMVRRSDFEALGGFCERFWCYCEDTDLCWRARAAGREVWFCPRALAHHEYEFDKGQRKWLLLERNRLWMVLANYELSTLLALAPVLLGFELAVIAAAVTGGWLGQKLGAYRELAQSLPWLVRRRASVQSSRRVADRELLAEFAAKLDSPLMAGPAISVANPVLVAYRRALLGRGRP